MRVFITGGAGYIGSHVALEAILSGHDVCIYDNYRTSPHRVGRLLGSMGAESVLGDILDQDSLQRKLREFSPDVVIHAAGLKRVDESQQIPLDYYRVNVAGTLSVLSAMENVGASRIVFSSSAAIYDETEQSVRENSPIKPKSVYGHTKVMCEQMISDFAQRGNHAVCLRYFNPVACHILLPESNSPTLMGVAIAVAGGRVPELKIFGDGSSVRDFIHVRDVARAHLRFTAAHGSQVYNIGTGRGTTVIEMVTELERVLGRELLKEFVEPREADIHRSVANCDLIRNSVGWEAARSINDMCRDAWESESLRLSSDL